MRFKKDGADIPEELIRAVKEGNAVFLCGAGVSMRVGLPNFQGLATEVYSRMGETYADEPPEKTAMGRDEYDRALHCLEKRTNFPGKRSRVRNHTADILAVPAGVSLPDHRILLDLSKDVEGRPRLLTTNFDTLFERAAIAAGMTNVPSHAEKALPKPGGPRDYGILHLHGRLADGPLPETDLVLTSADFGDAYLRDGWASRYIEDRMRLGMLVLVGYAAEDVALRLLLETLDADRSRFRDLKDIYALDRGTGDSASLWKAKGIKPIEFADYDRIYATLAEWAQFGAEPAEYSDRRLTEILKGP